ncbi:aminotransferase class V-fold PLP-dependent enzyme [Thermomicrobium sp. 4228-Ro]|uniref:aminotransferase class V-fold PLP-dependent enzyme n=1 Tax=Thermomicrobium sp. 4228-Ro TaxID=2993937 RepID=UPI00224991D1|nr:aminotransferase class V-fold PLP-dependent enzyme [Thermomicrobium sp. 4228-Ro]MCX2727592.1 aminotransferase class V-fold PLP-dependent enzyme [Thermomicrobium sp. 4228-Ro]
MWYERLGVRRVINADARLTRLGGSIMPPEVLQAMHEAAGWYVDLVELQRAVGRRLAELTNNEAAYVTAGAAAGLTLVTLACLTGPDPRAITRLQQQFPDLTGFKTDVVIHVAHRIPYDPAVRLAGVRLVQVGNVLRTEPSELEAALSERTAAILYVAGAHLSRGALPLEQVVEIAHAHGVPVIVDAAAQLPPPENLWRFTRDMGADVAIFSGGKDLAGPQSTGLIVGRAELIEAIALHGPPNQRLGRPFKVSREELIGLLAAVDRYLRLDHAARTRACEETIARWIARFAQLPGVRAYRAFPNEAGQPLPRLVLELDPLHCGMTARELRDRLWEGDPRIAVALHDERHLSLTAETLEHGEAELVAARIEAELGRA